MATFATAFVVTRAPAGVAVVALGTLIVTAAVRASRTRQHARLAEPNELRGDPVEDELDAFFDRIDRLPTDSLDMLAVRPLDGPAHDTAVARAHAAVVRLGRTAVLDRADSAIEDAVPRRLNAASYFSTGVLGVGGHLAAVDRVRLTGTLRDAALGIIARDGLDAQTYDELVGACRDLVPE